MSLIKCSECGMKISDKALSCPKCGCPIEDCRDGIQETGENEHENICQNNVGKENIEDIKSNKLKSEESNTAKEMKIQRGHEEKNPQKRKKGILLKIFVPIVIIAVGLVGFIVLKGEKSVDGMVPFSQAAFVDDEGVAYVKKDKAMMKIDGKYSQSMSSPDQKHYAALEYTSESELLVFDENGENPEGIGTDVTGIVTVKDNGVIYKKWLSEGSVDKVLKDLVHDLYGDITFEEAKEEFEEDFPGGTAGNAKDFYENYTGNRYREVHEYPIYRYMFDTKETVEVINESYTVALDSLSLMYTDGKSIYILPESKTDPVKVGECEAGTTVTVNAVSNNGELAVWYEDDYDTRKIYISDNEESQKLAELEYSDDKYVFTSFNNDDQEAIIVNVGDEKLYRKKANEEVKEISTGGIMSGVVFSDNQILYSDRGTVSNLYVEILRESEDGGYDLYLIDTEGEREKLLSGIASVEQVSNGKVFYIDQDDALYVADLGKTEISNEKKIGMDVVRASASYDGEYVYYAKNYDESTEQYDLYVCKTKGESLEPDKIASNVGSYFITSNGKEMAYISDTSLTPEKENDYGELYYKKLGKDSVKVSSDVMGVYKTNNYGMLEGNDMYFFKYTSTDEYGMDMGSYMHFNGKETEVLAEKLCFKE